MTPSSDPFRYFRVEARELLDKLGQGVLGLERGGRSDELANLLRLVHTLKGAARVVKQGDIAELAHDIEDALVPYRDSSDPISKELINRILQRLDAAGRAVAALACPAAPGAAAPSGQGDEVVPLVGADVAEIDDLINGLSETRFQLAALRRNLVGNERARHLVDLLRDKLTSSPDGAATARNGASPRGLQAIVDELGTLVGAQERALITGLEQVEREVALSRDSAERLRLVAAGALFSTMERAARGRTHAARGARARRRAPGPTPGRAQRRRAWDRTRSRTARRG